MGERLPVVSIHKRFTVLIEDHLDALCPAARRVVAHPGDRPGSDTSITSVDSLAGKTVCSVQGSTSIANIKKFAPLAKTVEYDIYF